MKEVEGTRHKILHWNVALEEFKGQATSSMKLRKVCCRIRKVLARL